MSDFPEGTDWWKATDGRWYSPPATSSGSPPPADGAHDGEIRGSEPDGWKGMGAQGSIPDTPKWKAAVYAVATIAGASLLIGWCSSAGGDDGSTADDLRAGAFDVCTQFVEKRLRAPGTASFRNYYEDDGEVTVTGSGDGPYTVISSVDAENGFGAEIRTDFVCEVRHVTGENWRLVDLTMGE